jgi:hypothetical protein
MIAPWLVDIQLVMECDNNLYFISKHSRNLLNHPIPLIRVKLMVPQSKGHVLVEIYPYHNSSHVHIYHMLMVLNFIRYGLPKFSPSHLYSRAKEEALHNEQSSKFKSYSP